MVDTMTAGRANGWETFGKDISSSTPPRGRGRNGTRSDTRADSILPVAGAVCQERPANEK